MCGGRIHKFSTAGVCGASSTFPPLTLALPMNLRSNLRTQNWRNSLELNGLTLALTPGRTSAWHHSPEERENRLPRFGDWLTLDLSRFMGSMREKFVRGNLSPFCSADFAKRGEGEVLPAHGGDDALWLRRFSDSL